MAAAKVVVASSIEEMAAMLRTGQVDVYVDSPFPTVVVSERSGAVPLVRRWKKGRGDYQSTIFVRADSGIDTLEQLRGRTIAFEDEYSTTGYFLPLAGLLQSGLKLVHHTEISSQTTEDEVGFVFSEDDEATILWVLRGKVAAGALDASSLEKLAGPRAGELKALYESPEVPRQIVSYRPDLEPALVATIETTLVEMAQDEEGKTVLSRFENTTKFDRFLLGPDSALLPIRELLTLTRAGQDSDAYVVGLVSLD